VNRDNVVPFVSSTRGALARRGAPDKSRVMLRRVDVECPHCAAVFSLDTGTVARDPKVLCQACEAHFTLARGEAAAD
jgi:nitrite reductase/ring-hydroxylating ferredoxin subunit